MSIRNLALLGASVILAFAIGLYVTPDGSVSGFNQGFSDSKLDDCQQGFQPACEWLQHTK
jgi:hypothetical protein